MILMSGISRRSRRRGQQHIRIRLELSSRRRVIAIRPVRLRQVACVDPRLLSTPTPASAAEWRPVTDPVPPLAQRESPFLFISRSSLLGIGRSGKWTPPPMQHEAGPKVTLPALARVDMTQRAVTIRAVSVGHNTRRRPRAVAGDPQSSWRTTDGTCSNNGSAVMALLKELHGGGATIFISLTTPVCRTCRTDRHLLMVSVARELQPRREGCRSAASREIAPRAKAACILAGLVAIGVGGWRAGLVPGVQPRCCGCHPRRRSPSALQHLVLKGADGPNADLDFDVTPQPEPQLSRYWSKHATRRLDPFDRRRRRF